MGKMTVAPALTDILPTDVADYLCVTIVFLKSQLRLLYKAHALSPGDLIAGLRELDVYIDKQVLLLPRRRGLHADLANALAERLHPSPRGSKGPIIRYEEDLIRLRRAISEHSQRDTAEAAAVRDISNWSRRILEQGPWDETNDPISLAGPPALPMPVELSDLQTLTPFFEHLKQDLTVWDPLDGGHQAAEPYYKIHLLEYQKGVLYADGRLDLCKKVVGPYNIEPLMDALRTNNLVRHFLLGNNVIGAAGARAIGKFILERPESIETWYLAGNCVDSCSLRCLVDAWVTSGAVTNIWLKRNPLGSAAVDDLFRLITTAPNLRTIDLDQTELGDAGVARLFSVLAEHIPGHPKLPLRHVYLNACGVGPKSLVAISTYLSSTNCSIESLYLSLNPLGSHIVSLLPGLQTNSSLQRLTLASTGQTDEYVALLLAAVTNHPSLRSLDLGQSYQTQDLSQRYNWLTGSLVDDLCNFISSSPKLQYLSLSYTLIPTGVISLPVARSPLRLIRLPSIIADSELSGLCAIHRTISRHTQMLYFSAKSIWPVIPDLQQRRVLSQIESPARGRMAANVQNGYQLTYNEFLAAEKRFLVSPRDVRFIDSVYRNRDAGMARRGEGRLEKYWGDERVLEEVKRVGADVWGRREKSRGTTS
ncbi:Ran GTPase-activating protein 1 [Sphaceloma murrayae]|uniref:Ran GTPase-activating protein 1 n=1 Tax=Sphaceloma murrayae TaxID=2082308 RepID=A0A2K1QU94_9PEZI|nr:Ran GTPase-activating protein 1 [Sphaceloma murrayae]